MSTYIQSGTTVRIYDSAVRTFASLPIGTYVVEFDKFSGFYLREVDDLKNTEKVYGRREGKVAKVFRSWDASDRSLGVLLSGDKGQGKTMFLRMLAEIAIPQGLPVIRVTQNFPGIAAFLDELGTAVVVFDEFEKVFDQRDDEGNMQAQFLSLFDGVSRAKRMYVVTVNDLQDVSDFLVNRPGRLLYHFRFDYPDPDAVREYLRDKVPHIGEKTLQAAVDFSLNVPINYDHLRAIAGEILTDPDAPFSEIIEDLNIKAVDSSRFRIVVTYADGSVLRSEVNIDLRDADGDYIYVRNGKRTFSAYVYPAQFIRTPDGKIIVPPDAVSMDGEKDVPTNITLELVRQRSFSYSSMAL